MFTTNADQHVLRKLLDQHRHTLAQHWYNAIVHVATGCTTVRYEQLELLTDQVIALLVSERLDHQAAKMIGIELATLCESNPEALYKSYQVIARHLVRGLPREHVIVFNARLITLLGMIATGFNQQSQLQILSAHELDTSAPSPDTAEVKAVLREREAFLQTIVSKARLLVFATDLQGVVTLAIGRGLERLGLKHNKVLGRSIFEIQLPAPEIVEYIRSALASESFTTVLEIGGRVFELRFGPYYNDSDTLTGAIAIGRDVTAHTRQLEQRALKILHETPLPALSPALDAQPTELASATPPGQPPADTLSPLLDGQTHLVDHSSDSAADVLSKPLTEREMEVLRLMAKGVANRDIATELNVSIPTVKKHIGNIFTKLEVLSRVQAVLKAKEINLV